MIKILSIYDRYETSQGEFKGYFAELENGTTYWSTPDESLPGFIKRAIKAASGDFPKDFIYVQLSADLLGEIL